MHRANLRHLLPREEEEEEEAREAEARADEGAAAPLRPPAPPVRVNILFVLVGVRKALHSVKLILKPLDSVLDSFGEWALSKS